MPPGWRRACVNGCRQRRWRCSDVPLRILEAVDAVGEFTTEGQACFLGDRKTPSAVIRHIEIIGEAVKRLSLQITAWGA